MPTFTATTTANIIAIPPNFKRQTLTILNTDAVNTVYLRANKYAIATITSSSNEYQLLPSIPSLFFQKDIHREITESSFQALSSAGTALVVWGESNEVVRRI